MQPQPKDPAELTKLTAEVISAYVSNNAVSRTDLSGLIAAVHASIAGIVAPRPAAEPSRPKPPVPIKKSITPDYLISLEDGRRYKSLKRHLGTRGLTPTQYRQKWGLPPDYPMVAPNYAKRRSELARSFGLGSMRRRDAAPQAPTRGKGAAGAGRRPKAKGPGRPSGRRRAA